MTTDYKSTTPDWPMATSPLPRRRIRGVRITAVPTLPALVQVVGGIAAISGVYLLWGIAITLIIGGVAVTALGALREAGKV